MALKIQGTVDSMLPRHLREMLSSRRASSSEDTEMRSIATMTPHASDRTLFGLLRDDDDIVRFGAARQLHARLNRLQRIIDKNPDPVIVVGLGVSYPFLDVLRMARIRKKLEGAGMERRTVWDEF